MSETLEYVKEGLDCPSFSCQPNSPLPLPKIMSLSPSLSRSLTNKPVPLPTLKSIELNEDNLSLLMSMRILDKPFDITSISPSLSISAVTTFLKSS